MASDKRHDLLKEAELGTLGLEQGMSKRNAAIFLMEDQGLIKPYTVSYRYSAYLLTERGTNALAEYDDA